MKLAIKSLLLSLAMTCHIASISAESTSAGALIQNLQLDPDGLVFIGADGVAQSLAQDETVLDSVDLNSQQLEQLTSSVEDADITARNAEPGALEARSCGGNACSSNTGCVNDGCSACVKAGTGLLGTCI